MKILKDPGDRTTSEEEFLSFSQQEIWRGEILHDLWKSYAPAPDLRPFDEQPFNFMNQWVKTARHFHALTH